MGGRVGGSGALAVAGEVADDGGSAGGEKFLLFAPSVFIESDSVQKNNGRSVSADAVNTESEGIFGGRGFAIGESIAGGLGSLRALSLRIGRVQILALFSPFCAQKEQGTAKLSPHSGGFATSVDDNPNHLHGPFSVYFAVLYLKFAQQHSLDKFPAVLSGFSSHRR